MDTAGAQRRRDLIKLDKVAAEAVQPPNRESVAGPEHGKRRLELRASFRTAAPVFGEDALAACTAELVFLKVRVLLFRGDPGVTDKHEEKVP